MQYNPKMTKVYGSNINKVNHMFTCGVEGGHGVTVADHANPLLGLRLRHPLLPRLVLGLERFNHFCELSIHDQFSILELILLLIKFTHFSNRRFTIHLKIGILTRFSIQ